MNITHDSDVLKSEKNLLSILQEIEAYIHGCADRGRPVHQVELGLWRRVLKLGRAALGQFFDLAGTGDLGPAVELPDGRDCQRLDELHPRRYVSIFGEFRLQRTAYGSREGQAIDFVPLDNRLSLPESVFSYVLQDWDQSFCVEESFAEVRRTVARILGITQSVDSLEHMNVEMAEDVADFRENRPQAPAEEEAELLVLSADGKGIVMRREADAPKPSAHPGKGEKASQKRMAIVGAAYSVDRHVRTPEQIVELLFHDHPERPRQRRPTPKHKHVWASLGWEDEKGWHSGTEAVYPWLLNEVVERNLDLSKEMVCLHDGQESLWDARNANLPRKNTTDVLDLLHVTPRLWQAAHLFYKEKSAEAETFVRERLLRILEGKAVGVVRGLREMSTKRGLSGTKKKALQKICSYLEANLDRMHYVDYLARGYPIASGVIEGACRHYVKDRMERAGMHWRRRGAQAMLDVRSTHVNGDWEAYQAYRIERESKRLYPYRSLVEGLNYTMAA